MASRKRRAEEHSEDDDSNISSSPRESGSISQPESSGRKRRRINQDSDTTPEQDPDRRRTSADEFTDDSDDEEEAERQATQAVADKRNRDRNAENIPREFGVLQRVEVHDFMNHHYFQFELGPLINFICGKNGSGKSALLTAIIICLGGKASTTSRGNSLKKFIREGCDRARIICTIKNEGEDAYMHDEFGDRIIVERHFSQSGTSGFSIKTASGRIYSNKRGELDPILDHCNLQMDNPLNVLTQDAAREFLHKSSPADKYKFFLKGVQLEQLDQDYRLIDEQLFNIHPRLERKREDVTALEQDMERKVQQRELARKRDGMRQKARDIRKQIVWIQVQTQEEIVKDYDNNIEETRSTIAGLEADVEQKEAEHQRLVEASTATEQALSEAIAARDRGNEEKGELRVLLDEAKKEVQAAHTEQRAVKDALDAAKRAVQKKQQEIVTEQRHLDEVNGDGPAQRQRELADAREAVEHAKRDYETHKNQKDTLDRDASQKKSIIAVKQAEKEKAEENVADTREKLQQLRHTESQSWNAFPPGTEQLVKLIEKDNRFQHKPIGPVGKHVRLLEAEWSGIVERVFGKSLNAFIVFNQHDHNILNELKDRARCKAEVARTQRTLFDLKEPDQRFKTIHRILEIDNAYVQKHLVINHAIEQALLIPDLKEATNTMYDNGRLHNVNGCYAQHDADKRNGMFLRYSPDGGPSQDPVHRWEGPARMKTDQAAMLAERQRALERAQNEVFEATQIWQGARAEFVKADQAVQRHKKRQHDLKISYQRAEDDVERLTSEIEGDQIDNGKLDQLKDLLREAQEQMQLTENQFKDAVVNHDAKKAAMRERQRIMAEYDSTIQDLLNAFEAAQVEHRKADQKRNKALLDKNAVLGTLSDTRGDLQRTIQIRQAADTDRVNLTTAAEEAYEHRVEIPPGATYQSLNAKFEKIEEDRRRFQRELGFSMEEAEENAVKAKKAFEQAQKDFSNLEETREALEKSLRDRRARWLKFRRFITVRARVTFVKMLSERGFRGELLINHDKHLLDLRVEPDITKSSATGRGAKTLSGGEKSFSQICMLLAMWEAMGSPIRCLDEFDVFMDAVNRSQSIKLIIEAARQSVGKQYILISPGSKTDIEKADDVHAMELVPPIRGQRTLEASDPRFGRVAQLVAVA